MNVSFYQNTLIFLRKNWFQVGIGLLFLYVLFQKNFSFSINFHSPTKQEQVSKPKRKTLMTEAPEGISKNDEKLNFNFSDKSHSSKKILSNIDESIKVEFLKRFAHVAVSEQEKFNIPASIILANAMLMSEAGTGDFFMNGNNLFALKCFDTWDNERILKHGYCYRKYNSPWLSFRDHSKFITSGKYKSLKRLGYKNYKKWAQGLEELHFSNHSGFAHILIDIIEKYNLHELDKRA